MLSKKREVVVVEKKKETGPGEEEVPRTHGSAERDTIFSILYMAMRVRRAETVRASRNTYLSDWGRTHEAHGTVIGRTTVFSVSSLTFFLALLLVHNLSKQVVVRRGGGGKNQAYRPREAGSSV